MMAPRIRTKVWLEVEGRFVVGDGGLQLLLGIARDGSLAAAVRRIGWSYRHAWGYLRRAERALGVPLTRPRPGKGASRGTRLTEHGLGVLRWLVDTRRRVDRAVGPAGPSAEEIAVRGRRPRARAVRG